MARIRKIHRMSQTRKVNNEKNSDSEIENLTRSSRFSVQVLNSRKKKLQEISRRVYQHLKNYSDNFNNLSDLAIMNKKSLSCSILSNTMERNWILYDSKFTQTSENDILQYALRKISNSSTQTEPWMEDANNIEMNAMEMSELNTSSTRKNTCSVKSSLGNLQSLKTDIEKDIESSEGILLKNSRNGTVERKILLKKSIFVRTNQNIYKNDRLTPSKIPIWKHLPKTKCEETKQLRKKKRPFSLKTKSRKTMNFHTVKNIIEKEKHSPNYEHKLTLCNEFINNMKKYSEIATEWSMRILKVFSDLGISLKKNLNKIYELYDAQTSPYLNFCGCDRYRQEVIMLGCKMKELESQIKSLSEKTSKKIDNAEKYQEIYNKLNKIDRDVESFVAFKTEMAILKKQLKEKSESSNACMSPFLPPPPPPLPPPPASCNSISFMKVRQDDRPLKRFNESRPIITLEDILKVKLKKISVMDI